MSIGDVSTDMINEAEEADELREEMWSAELKGPVYADNRYVNEFT